MNANNFALPILQVYVGYLPRIASVVAFLLKKIEVELARGESSGAKHSEILLRLNTMRSSLEIYASEKLIEIFTNEDLDSVKHYSTRLISIINKSLRKIYAPQRKRRPDIFAVCAEFLTNPASPPSHYLSNFAVVTALRSLYGIEVGSVAIEALRQSYEDIDIRFQTTKKRRVLSRFNGIDNFLLDLLTLNGYLYLGHSDLNKYYDTFLEYPLGIDPVNRTRVYSRVYEGKHLPEIHGLQLPDFPKLLPIAFGQPLLIPGLDQVLGGVMPTPSKTSSFGGLITLISGPPGNGKTTLCLSLALKMAECGSIVKYLALEESETALLSKLVSIGSEPRTSAIDNTILENVDVSKWTSRLSIISGSHIESFQEIANSLEQDLIGANEVHTGNDLGVPVFPIFRRVLIIDSVSTLFRKIEEDGLSSDYGRKNLAEVFLRLRDSGVCIYLVGSEEDRRRFDIAYLVDNDIQIFLDDKNDASHPVRKLVVNKTRIQTSYRGQHVFHLSKDKGCRISPSLHATLRILQEKKADWSFKSSEYATIWRYEEQQLSLEFTGSAIRESQTRNAVRIKSGSHTLIYGHGSTRKAKLALLFALEPRVQLDEEGGAGGFDSKHQLNEIKYSDALKSTRILVISFLYDGEYYKDVLKEIITAKSWSKSPPSIDVLSIYPGYIDPETVLSKINDRIQESFLEQRPITGVVIDGLHNVIIQFPLLEKETLLWPTLFRLIRSYKLDAVSTYTFFEMLEINTAKKPNGERIGGEVRVERLNQDILPDDAWKNVFNLLASACDYTFIIEKKFNQSARHLELLVAEGDSIDKAHDEKSVWVWNSNTLKAVPKTLR